MARRSGLGRGLGALIPTEGAKPAAGMREIALAKIRPNKLQPRTTFDEAALASLVDSIRAVGILQPVLVREVGDDEYELIAGERRWRAARRAGMIAIPALVQVADDEASLEQALVENIHREGLNPLDEAAGYQQLIEDFHLTHDAVAHRVGKSRAAVTNALRLFQLPPSVQRYLRDGQLSAGHARALLMTPDRNLQERLAHRSAEEELSVRGLEQLVHGSQPAPVAESAPVTTPSPPRPPSALRPPGVLELEELLAAHLNTRVRVEMNRDRGKLTIEFAGLEDLERIYRLMIGEPSTGA
ncbi:MAG: ParB/RepB/Spo0J family partition protein [Acidimicrobiales bacterium]